MCSDSLFGILMQEHYQSVSKVGLSWRRSASGLDRFKLNEVSIVFGLKKKIWNFIHQQVHRTKRDFLRTLYSLCLALNVLVFTLSISQINDGVCLVPKWAPKSDRTICQAIVPSYGVRHRFPNKINFFECMMDSPEKHWRACKRGALPTEL